ncbi:hypothetical protein FACS1894145_4640 [Bacteroidia bacterium]|nr:hypothetical protein FACS1894145_4640 [Bacteroidia bacterium]
MKTKEIFLVIFCAFFCLSGAAAQTYYYNTTQTFNENGYSYQCDKPEWGLIELYNTNNIYTYANYVYKDGSEITDTDILRGNTKLIESDNWTRQKCFSIINAAFSGAEKQRVKGQKFDVSMTINTSTGKVIEVDFRFMYNDPFATIPVSTYRKIELDLKSQIWFTLTNTGKQLKFIHRGWLHEVE